MNSAVIVTAAVRSTNQSDHSTMQSGRAVRAAEQSDSRAQSDPQPRATGAPSHMDDQTDRPERVSYSAAGVDIEAGDRAVELFAPLAKRASRPEVQGGLGGFAGLFALKPGYREPLLAASTDGVGTKIAVAQAMDKHDTVGLDLVAMVVDDLVVCGAEPLFLQDYIAVGRVIPEKVALTCRRHRGGLRAGRVRPAGRRDGRASRTDGRARLRPVRHRGRRGGGRRRARSRSGPSGRRRHRVRGLRGCTPTATASRARSCSTSTG